MGNHPVRFLGEGAAAMPFPYPTPAEEGGGGRETKAREETCSLREH
jgi:hypothetical protein